MPSNVEIKARVKNLDNLEKLVRSVADQQQGLVLEQTDTFFHVPKGRLKLREIQDKTAQLIFYERSDQAGPKHCDYHITEEHNPQQLKVTLEKALGVIGCVQKKRTLYMIGQTRVHLDRVTALGEFMELEVVLKSDQTTAEGQAIAEDIMKKLNISDEDLITCAYMDLIINGGNK